MRSGTTSSLDNARHRRNAMRSADPTAAPAIVAVDRQQPRLEGRSGAAGPPAALFSARSPMPSATPEQRRGERDQVGQSRSKPLKSNALGQRMVGPAGLEPATRRL